MKQHFHRWVLAVREFKEDISWLLSAALTNEAELASLAVQDNFQPSGDSASPSHSFPKFLLLPRELRDQIYKYALTDRKRIYAPRVWLPSIDDGHRSPISSLVLANRQLNKEGNSILYSENRFYFYAPQDKILFLARIGERNKSFVKRIGIMVDCTDPLSAIRLLHLERPARLWLKTLSASQSKGVVDMEVLGYKEPFRFYEEVRMNSELEMAIKGTLGCGDDKRFVRKVSLIGFGQKERTKFLQNWKVVVDSY